MRIQNQEVRVNFAIEAIRSSKKISCRAATRLYNVPETTIRYRINGRTTMADRHSKVHNLMANEEEVVVEYILYLDARGYPSLIGDVAAIANDIL